MLRNIKQNEWVRRSSGELVGWNWTMACYPNPWDAPWYKYKYRNRILLLVGAGKNNQTFKARQVIKETAFYPRKRRNQQSRDLNFSSDLDTGKVCYLGSHVFHQRKNNDNFIHQVVIKIQKDIHPWEKHIKPRPSLYKAQQISLLSLYTERAPFHMPPGSQKMNH